jgi:hypothetical protein
LQAELSGCRERIAVLETELTDMETSFTKEKRDIEQVAHFIRSELTISVPDG